MTIRPAVPCDLPLLADLDLAVCGLAPPSGWGAGQLRRFVRTGLVKVITADGRPVGYAAASADEVTLDVARLVTKSAAAAVRLVRHLEPVAPGGVAVSVPDRTPARVLRAVARLGYAAGLARGHFGGADAVRFTKNVTSLQRG